MAVISSNEIKNGTVVQIDGKIWTVLWFQHHKPGKGNTVIRLKIRDIRSGSIVERTIPADQKIEAPSVEKREMSFLYHDGTHYVFMDQQTYDQISVEEGELGENKNWLTEGIVCSMAILEGRPISVELPASVELKIEHTDPGVKGDRVSGATKPARLQTGATIQVPLFVDTGDMVRVDTRTGEYITRVS